MSLLTCCACGANVGTAGMTPGAFVFGEAHYLCAACWDKVERRGRSPRQTIEAVVRFRCDPAVGGEADPLDENDYEDLKRLGLWEPT
ncbi:MAG: hypothetical protein GXP27_00860 [Planctomycetes bacterium]|nr:hypothetical protein [Planctomycetota bacterium]